MEINITIYSSNTANDFDLVNFSIEQDCVQIALKSCEGKDKIIDVDIEDFKKLVKIINDINL